MRSTSTSTWTGLHVSDSSFLREGVPKVSEYVLPYSMCCLQVYQHLCRYMYARLSPSLTRPTDRSFLVRRADDLEIRHRYLWRALLILHDTNSRVVHRADYHEDGIHDLISSIASS